MDKQEITCASWDTLQRMAARGDIGACLRVMDELFRRCWEQDMDVWECNKIIDVVIEKCLAEEEGACLILERAAAWRDRAEESVDFIRNMEETFADMLRQGTLKWVTPEAAGRWITRLFELLGNDIERARRAQVLAHLWHDPWFGILPFSVILGIFECWSQECLIALSWECPYAQAILEGATDHTIDVVLSWLGRSSKDALQDLLRLDQGLGQWFLTTSRLSREQVAKVLSLPIPSDMRMKLAQKGIGMGR